MHKHWKWMGIGLICSLSLLTPFILQLQQISIPSWNIKLDSPQSIQPWHIAVDSEYFYLATNDCRVWAVEKETGSLKWEFMYETGQRLCSDKWLLLDNRELYINYAGTNSVIALNTHDGEMLWHSYVPVSGGNPILISSQGLLLLQAGKTSTQLVAVDSANGKLLWKYDRETSSCPVVISGDIVVAIANADYNRCYITSETSHIVALNIQTGEELWTQPASALGSVGWTPYAPVRGCTGKKERVLLTGYSGILSIDSLTGELIWEYTAEQLKDSNGLKILTWEDKIIVVSLAFPDSRTNWLTRITVLNEATGKELYVRELGDIQNIIGRSKRYLYLSRSCPILEECSTKPFFPVMRFDLKFPQRSLSGRRIKLLSALLHDEDSKITVVFRHIADDTPVLSGYRTW